MQPMDLSLRQFAVQLAKRIDETWNKTETMCPMWIIDGSNGVTVMGTPWSNDHEKSLMVKAVKAYMKEHDAKRYVHIAEVWMLDDVDKVPESIARGGKVSSHPQRKEAVIAMAEDRSGKAVHVIRKITRRGDEATLSEPEIIEFEKSMTQGILTHMLPE